MPKKERLVVRSRKNKSHKARHASLEPIQETSLISLFRLVDRKGVQPVLDRYPGMAYQLAAIRHMQQTSGNAAVNRYLLSLPANEAGTGQKKPAFQGPGNTLQRQKEAVGSKTAPTVGEKEPGAKEASVKEPAFDLDKWLSKEVYDLVKSQVGESKLNEYAKSLAKKAGELLLKQMEGILLQEIW